MVVFMPSLSPDADFFEPPQPALMSTTSTSAHIAVNALFIVFPLSCDWTKKGDTVGRGERFLDVAKAKLS
jgi:hypothetical protein